MPSPSHGFLDSTRTDRLPAWEFPLRFPEDFVCGSDRKAVTQVATLWRRHLCSLLIPRPPGNTPSPAKKGPIHPTPPPSRFPHPAATSHLFLVHSSWGWTGQLAASVSCSKPAPRDVRLCLLIRRLSEARFAPVPAQGTKALLSVCAFTNCRESLLQHPQVPSAPLHWWKNQAEQRWQSLFPFTGNEFLLTLRPYHPCPHLWFKSGSHRRFSCYRKMYIVWQWKAGAMSRALKRPWGLIRVKRERIYDG